MWFLLKRGFGMPRFFLWCLPVTIVGSVATSSHADEPSTENRALAEVLFREAKALSDQERFDEACPKFQESHRLDPKPGTILNLAVCHEKQGKTASAWLDFIEAASFAARAGQKDRESFAKDQATKLEQQLSRLTVRVPDAAPGIVVKVDAAVLSSAAWGTAAPINPGAHSIEAAAPGYATWSMPVTIEKGPSAFEVVVPKLQPLDVPKPPDATVPNDSNQTPQQNVQQQNVQQQNVQPDVPKPPNVPGVNKPLWIGVATGAVGLAGIVMGAAFGMRTFSQRDAGNAECGPPPGNTYCTKAGIELHAQAQTSATISTVGFVVGGVGLGAGAVMVLLGLRKPTPAPSRAWVLPHAGATGAGVMAGFSF
jgi:hypothetical protein